LSTAVTLKVWSTDRWGLRGLAGHTRKYFFSPIIKLGGESAVLGIFNILKSLHLEQWHDIVYVLLSRARSSLLIFLILFHQCWKTQFSRRIFTL